MGPGQIVPAFSGPQTAVKVLPILFLMLVVDRAGPDEILAPPIGRVVEYDSGTRTDAGRGRQD